MDLLVLLLFVEYKRYYQLLLRYNFLHIVLLGFVLYWLGMQQVPIGKYSQSLEFRQQQLP